MSYAIFFIVCDLFYFTSSKLNNAELQRQTSACSRYGYFVVKIYLF